MASLNTDLALDRIL